MRRVHPKELLEIPPEELSKFQALSDPDSLKRSEVDQFSWNIATKYMEQRIRDHLGRPKQYFLDGRAIQEENFLQSITIELCQEYGLQLLDVMADLILPVGFGYPSLIETLESLVADAFKPISAVGRKKTIVWIEDAHWNDVSNSILEVFMRELLMRNVEPFLVAPKYFDNEAISMLSRVMNTKIVQNQEPNNPSSSSGKSQQCWRVFSTLLKFGYLLLSRSTNCPLIVIHMSPKIAEKTNAFEFLDLGESEGHEVLFLKNTALSHTERISIVKNFIQKLLKVPSLACNDANIANLLEGGGNENVSMDTDYDNGENQLVGLENMSSDEFSISEYEENEIC